MSNAANPKHLPAESEDLRLLKEHPNKFIEKNQPLIKNVVRYFVTKGFIREQQVTDLIQSVNEKLLSHRIKKMQQQYNASVKLQTYFSKVVFNLCREQLRSQSKHTNIYYDSDYIEQSSAGGGDSLSNLIIADELDRLNLIFRVFFKDKIKLLLALKIMSRMPLKQEDFKRFCPDFTAKEIREITASFQNDFARLSNKELYERCQFFLNRCGYKTSSADAIRKWVDARLNDIRYLLNTKGVGHEPLAYTKETVKILIRKYFEREENKNSNFNK